MIRRRPVPRAWREEHHSLDQHTRYWSGGAVRGSRVYRSGGTCSCGATFGLRADKHNMDAADVRDAWLNHVEDAYYSETDATPETKETTMAKSPTMDASTKKLFAKMQRDALTQETIEALDRAESVHRQLGKAGADAIAALDFSAISDAARTAYESLCHLRQLLEQEDEDGGS